MSASEAPAPSVVPPPSDKPHPLVEQINIATRPIHSQLNRLILVRLPLALPPYTTNPSSYVSGLLYITPIYSTFESLWQTIIDAPQLPTSLKKSFDACDPEQPLLDSRSIPIIPNADIPPLVHTPNVCSRTHSLLSHLRLPGLLRAGRLRADIRILTRTPEQRIDEQLEAVSHNGKLKAFISHIRCSVEANPHVLLAYAWVLYMALFSGGRYLRASLKEAGGSGHDFWSRDPSPVRPYSITRPRRYSRTHSEYVPPPTTTRPSRPKNHSDGIVPRLIPDLQFFSFVGDEDGEDLKNEFKKRIAETEILLTSGEKQDIITEAQHIFAFMVELVREIDEVIGTKIEDLEFLQNRPLRSPRDSVMVERERRSRRDKDRKEPQSFSGEVKAPRYITSVTCLTTFLTGRGLMQRFFKEGSPAHVTFELGVEQQRAKEVGFEWNKFFSVVLPVTVMLLAFAFWSLGIRIIG